MRSVSTRAITTSRRSRLPPRTVLNQFQSERSWSIPRLSTTFPVTARAGSLRVPENGSEPTRYSTTSILVAGMTTSRNPVSGRPSIRTWKLKLRYGASSGIARHLSRDVGEVAVDRELVLDRRLVRVTGGVRIRGRDHDAGRLLTSKERRAGVEQRADLTSGAEVRDALEERKLRHVLGAAEPT